MKNIALILIAALITQNLAIADKIFTDDNVRVGVASSSAKKKVIANTGAGSAGPYMAFDPSAGQWVFSNDGTNSKGVGSGSGGGASGIPLPIQNGDFESGKTGWTADVSGHFAINVNTTPPLPLDGKQSAVFSPSSINEKIVSAFMQVQPALQGKGCSSSLIYQTSESANPYVFYAKDGSGNLLATEVLNPTPSGSISSFSQPLNYLCPALQVRATTTGNLSSSTTCISSPGSLTGIATGLYVLDSTNPAHISAGTTVTGLPGACPSGQIQMSTNAAATATGDTLTFSVNPNAEVQVSVAAPSSGAPISSLTFDDVLAGQNAQYQLSQAQWLGQIKYTGGTSSDITVTSVNAFTITGSTITTTGSVTAPSGTNMGVKIPYLGAGSYSFVVNGTEQCFQSGSTSACLFGMSSNGGTSLDLGSVDVYIGVGGSSSINMVATSQTFSYLASSSASNAEFVLGGKVSSTSTTLRVSPGAINSPGSTIDVYYFPSSAQGATSITTTPATWDGAVIAGGTPWTNTSSTITDFNIPSGTNSVVVSAANNISCVPESNNYPGVTCQMPVAGLYRACIAMGINVGAGSSSGSYILSDGANNPLSPFSNEYQFPTAGQPAPASFCATANVPAAGPFTFKIRGNSSGSVAAYVFGPGVNFNIQNISQVIPGPVLTSKTVTSPVDNMKMVSAIVASGGSPVSQTGSWISTGTGSTGAITYPITSGVFSAAPVCVVSSLAPTYSNTLSTANATSATSVSVSQEQASSGTPVNADFGIICFGPQ